MQHIFTPTYKHQRSIFWGDLLVLILMVAVSQYLFEENSKRFFSVIWPSSMFLFLYLFGRYSRVSTAVSLTKITTLIVSIGLSLLVSYPFMSGSDRGRMQFVVFLLWATMGCLLFVSVIRKFSADNVAVRFSFFTRDVEKYASRIEEIRQKLSPCNQKIAVVKDFDNIKHKDNSMFYVVEDTILEDQEFSARLLEQCIQGSSIVHFVDSYADITGRIPLELVNYQWLIEHTSPYSQNPIFLRVNRMMDITVGTLLSLILFLPILLIALVVKLESNGPVFFKQERIGLYKQPFTIYKFRSMKIDAEANGPQWATKNDSRVTRIGFFLRKTHLDELPQLLNLLKGDLTLVGPRPIRKFFADKLAQKIPYYHLRSLLKPGITGWAQVKGPYGVNMKEERVKFEMDLYYILKANFLLNLFILIDTTKTLFRGQQGP